MFELMVLGYAALFLGGVVIAIRTAAPLPDPPATRFAPEPAVDTQAQWEQAWEDAWTDFMFERAVEELIADIQEKGA